MILKKWENIPEEMRNAEVRYYYDILIKKKKSLFFKRIFDIAVSAVMLVLLSPVFLVLAVAVKAESKGPVFYRQERVTQYGKRFRIFKFRTMVCNADTIGAHVTVNNDSRITRVGKFIRKYRLDEISQLIDVFRGTMTFVGTRPEVVKYVDSYTPEMMATLLLPAGITSEASIFYKDESDLINNFQNADKVYIEEVLPQKMVYNLNEIENYGFFRDIRIMIMTVLAVLGKEYVTDKAQPVSGPDKKKQLENVR